MCAHDYEKLIIYYTENQKCGLGGEGSTKNAKTFLDEDISQ